MAELKTQKTDKSVQDYLDAIDDEQRKQDCQEIYHIMKSAAGSEGKMWGSSIIGFGDYHYKYESGREGDWFLAGFSNRKQNITLYIMTGFLKYEELLEKLGKHKTGKSCLYIKTLSDVDEDVLKKLIISSVSVIEKKYKTGD
ncbi:MAG: DUF1801 domain-containing protein [Balneolaceae bacterium]